jgi:hypothetical protein
MTSATASPSIHINRVGANFEREPLVRPFGFKGGYSTEIWQSATLLESAAGRRGVGLCTQGVLWSDAAVFAAHSESGGNALMYAVTEWAVQRLKGQHFAAWLLYAAENGITNFDDLIPAAYRPALAHKHEKIASIPLMAYAVPISELKAAVDDGYFFMKIKIGQPGTQEEMLEKDKARISAIHTAIGHARTPYTANGKLPYYFDANGRYESKEALLRLIDHAKQIGAYDQIALIEEPFPEEMGYKAIALKPIAKTLSMSLKIAQLAHERGVPCFCADLTVTPLLIEWNKNVAARLAPFPGLGLGLVETNGHQNYRNWETLRTYHPAPDAPWARTVRGVFNLGPDFYARSGGIFEAAPHYAGLFPAPA